MGSAYLESIRRETSFLRSSFWDLSLVTWIPLLLMAVVAVQMSAGVMRDLPVVVVDQDGGRIGRELSVRLNASPGLQVTAHLSDMPAAEELVRSRRAFAIVLVPEGAEQDILRGGTARIITFYNASYSTPSGAALREINVVTQAYAARLAADQSAAIVGVAKVRPPPILVQSTVLFNPQGSYELQLVALVHPALLHLVFMVAVTSALGRELRDGTIGAWLAAARNPVAAVAGKLTPYLAVFMLWSLLATGYLAGIRGWPIAGSPIVIFVGYAAMYLAYTGVALLVIGLTRSMVQSLSVAGLYAGASFAFAGVIFPVESASPFAQVWSSLLPYTSFANLLSEQWVMGSPVGVSLQHIPTMLLFVLPGILLGLPPYIRAAHAPAVWGRR